MVYLILIGRGVVSAICGEVIRILTLGRGDDLILWQRYQTGIYLPPEKVGECFLNFGVEGIELLERGILDDTEAMVGVRGKLVTLAVNGNIVWIDVPDAEL